MGRGLWVQWGRVGSEEDEDRHIVLSYLLEIYRCFSRSFHNLITKNTLKIKINHKNHLLHQNINISKALFRY
jgi:hypothetical protein